MICPPIGPSGIRCYEGPPTSSVLANQLGGGIQGGRGLAFPSTPARLAPYKTRVQLTVSWGNSEFPSRRVANRSRHDLIQQTGNKQDYHFSPQVTSRFRSVYYILFVSVSCERIQCAVLLFNMRKSKVISTCFDAYNAVKWFTGVEVEMYCGLVLGGRSEGVLCGWDEEAAAVSQHFLQPWCTLVCVCVCVCCWLPLCVCAECANLFVSKCSRPWCRCTLPAILLTFPPFSLQITHHQAKLCLS